jgi:hypothetical protein
MRTALVYGVSALLVGVAGCAEETGGNEATQPDAGGSQTQTFESQSQDAAAFSDEEATAYATSYDLCGFVTVTQLAAEYGSAGTAIDAAEAYARTAFRPEVRQAAFTGCLDAFNGRVSRIE